MRKIIEKYRLSFIITILVFCSVIIESPFHGFYPPLGFIFLSTVSILVFYLIPEDKLILAEKILYSFLMSFPALFGAAAITEIILGTIYGYDSNFYDELQSPPIFENLLLYFFTHFIGIGIFSIWLKYKKPIY